MADKFPFTLGNITLLRFDSRVKRYVGKCACGDKVTLSQYEVTHKKILQCAKCSGINMNLEDDQEEHTLSAPGTDWIDPLLGKTFGCLTVQKILRKKKMQFHGRVELLCLKCNNTIALTRHGLALRYKARGADTDCGCKLPLPKSVPPVLEPPRPPVEDSLRIRRNEDLTGLRIGYLRVIKQASASQARRTKATGRIWIVQCAVCTSPAIYFMSSGQINSVTKRNSSCGHCAEYSKRRKDPLQQTRAPHSKATTPSKKSSKPIEKPRIRKVEPKRLRSGVIS